MRHLVARVLLFVGLRLARRLVTIGHALTRYGDQLGTRAFIRAQRLVQGQQHQREQQQNDPDKTPNDRPPCPGCGRPGGTGHEPNCAII